MNYFDTRSMKVNSDVLLKDYLEGLGLSSSLLFNSKEDTLAVKLERAVKHLNDVDYGSVIIPEGSIELKSSRRVPLILAKTELSIRYITTNNRYPINTESRPISNEPYQVGDMVMNSDVISNRCIGWVCVEQGKPGKWKEFGQIREHYTEVQVLDHLPQASELQVGRQVLLSTTPTWSLWICKKKYDSSYVWVQQDFVIGTSEERPSNPQTGFHFYNTTVNRLQWYTGSEWMESMIASDVQDIRDEIEGARQTKNSLLLNLQDKDTKISKNTTDISNLESKVTDLTGDYDGLNQSFTQHERDYNSSKETIKAQGTKITNLETEINTARGGKSNLKLKLDEIESGVVTDLNVGFIGKTVAGTPTEKVSYAKLVTRGKTAQFFINLKSTIDATVDGDLQISGLPNINSKLVRVPVLVSSLKKGSEYEWGIYGELSGGKISLFKNGSPLNSTSYRSQVIEVSITGQFILE